MDLNHSVIFQKTYIGVAAHSGCVDLNATYTRSFQHKVIVAAHSGCVDLNPPAPPLASALTVAAHSGCVDLNIKPTDTVGTVFGRSPLGLRGFKYQ